MWRTPATPRVPTSCAKKSANSLCVCRKQMTTICQVAVRRHSANRAPASRSRQLLWVGPLGQFFVEFYLPCTWQRTILAEFYLFATCFFPHSSKILLCQVYFAIALGFLCLCRVLDKINSANIPALSKVVNYGSGGDSTDEPGRLPGLPWCMCMERVKCTQPPHSCHD